MSSKFSLLLSNAICITAFLSCLWKLYTFICLFGILIKAGVFFNEFYDYPLLYQISAVNTASIDDKSLTLVQNRKVL